MHPCKHPHKVRSTHAMAADSRCKCLHSFGHRCLLVLLCLGCAVASFVVGAALAAGCLVVLPLGYSLVATLHGNSRWGYKAVLGGLCAIILAWPFLTCFWLGPMGPEALLAGNLVFLASAIMTVWAAACRLESSLHKFDEYFHKLETVEAEQDPMWKWHLLAALADWYQLSALAFNVPSLLLPVAMKDLLNAFFALGRLALPLVPPGAAQAAGFLLADALLCCCVLFAAARLTAPIAVPCMVAILYSQEVQNDGGKESISDEGEQRIGRKIEELGLSWLVQAPGQTPADLKVTLLVSSTLVGCTQANMQVFACKRDDAFGMVWPGDENLQCWTGIHSAMAWTACLVLITVLPIGFLTAVVCEANAQKEQVRTSRVARPARISTHCWFLLVEWPVKLLVVALAIQSAAFGNIRLRLVALTLGAFLLVVLSQVLCVTSHIGLSQLRRVALLSALINSAFSWLTYEISDERNLTSTGLFLAGHIALGIYNSHRSERVLSRPSSSRTVRRINRLLLLVHAVGAATVLGFLPDLLTINTGAHTERGISMSGLNMSISTGSCAIFLKSVDCNYGSHGRQFAGEPAWFSGTAAQGQVKLWTHGAADVRPGRVSTSATLMEACELWLLMLPNSTVDIECNGSCALHAQGSFVGS